MCNLNSEPDVNNFQRSDNISHKLGTYMFHFIFVIAVYYNLIKSGINNATRKNEQVLKIGIGMQLNIISLDLCEQLSFSRHKQY